MKKNCFLSISLIVFSFCFHGKVNAQGGVAINAAGAPPDSSALIDLSSTTRGTLITRMTTAQRDAIVKPATGLQIFNMDCYVINYNAGTPSNPNWATVSASNVLTANVTIAANPVGAVCAGSSVTFTATPANGINSPGYQWKVNGANVGSNSNTYTTSSLNSGDVVTCVLTSSAPCVTGSPATSNPITMLVNTVPSITGTTPSSFCSGSAVTLGASASLGTINWYADSTGGSSLSSGASFTTAGLYSSTTFYVDATANGCTTATRTAVSATSFPSSPAEPGAITGPVISYADSTATYSISPLSNTSNYSWAVSLGNVVSGQGTTSIAVTWGDSTGTASISVVANNPCGSSVAQTQFIDVGTETFTYTGAQQVFTVPAGSTQLTFQVYGAQGGTVNSNTGGLGGYATGSLNVTGGDVLYIYVGGQPTSSAGGFNGGGNGYGSYAEGGGGASDVRTGGTGLGNRIIVAGGGGGATFNWTTTGGSGGGTNGGNGTSSNGTGFTGTGGTQNSGGSPEDEYDEGTPGSLGQGGNAASANGDDGGGGGGYYGGGGGSAGGGGGGSGYIGGVTNGNMQNGIQPGNGKVIVIWN